MLHRANFGTAIHALSDKLASSAKRFKAFTEDGGA